MLKIKPPARRHPIHQRQCILALRADQFVAGNFYVVLIDRDRPFEIHRQFIGEPQFIFERQLDVDVLNAFRIITETIQRNHHVFIDLEGVGVFGNRCRARAIKPEFLARFRCDGHEAFAVTGVGDAHHRAGRLHRGVLIVRNNVADQHHFWPLIAA